MVGFIQGPPGFGKLGLCFVQPLFGVGQLLLPLGNARRQLLDAAAGFGKGFILGVQGGGYRAGHCGNLSGNLFLFRLGSGQVLLQKAGKAGSFRQRPLRQNGQKAVRLGYRLPGFFRQGVQGNGVLAGIPVHHRLDAGIKSFCAVQLLNGGAGLGLQLLQLLFIFLDLGLGGGQVFFVLLPALLIGGQALFILVFPVSQLFFTLYQIIFRVPGLLVEFGQGLLIVRPAFRKLRLGVVDFLLGFGQLFVPFLFAIGKLRLGVVDFPLGLLVDFLIPGLAAFSGHLLKIIGFPFHSIGVSILKGGKALGFSKGQVYVRVDLVGEIFLPDHQESVHFPVTQVAVSPVKPQIQRRPDNAHNGEFRFV